MHPKLRKRKLGKWQIAALEDIVQKRVCCHLRILDKVGGTAKKWDRKYKRSLLRAIDAHNCCLAINSPVDPNFVIELGSCGYYLVERAKSARYKNFKPDVTVAKSKADNYDDLIDGIF